MNYENFNKEYTVTSQEPGDYENHPELLRLIEDIETVQELVELEETTKDDGYGETEYTISKGDNNTIFRTNKALELLFKIDKLAKKSLDMTKFNEHYNIVEQEPMDILYDVDVIPYVDNIEGISQFHELVSDYNERDDRLERAERSTYFIYDDMMNEVFQSQDDEELLKEILKISVKLEEEYEEIYK